MNRIRKLISISLVVVLMISSLPIPISAASSLPSSTVASEEGELEMTFAVTSEWINGYNVEVTLRNLTGEDIPFWTIGLDMSEENEIVTIWNATLDYQEFDVGDSAFDTAALIDNISLR